MESVNGNSITISEGGYTWNDSPNYDYCIIQTLTRSQVESARNGKFLGYVYLTHDHVYTNWTETVKATCTTAGTHTGYCSCGATQNRTISPLGHNYSDWITKSAETCTTEGIQTQICSRCDDKQQQTIAAKGHNYGDWTVIQAATCTAEGSRGRTCSQCADAQVPTIPKTDHQYTAGTVGGTCIEPAYVRYTQVATIFMRFMQNTIR